MTGGLHMRIDGRVMILTMDRPKANAIDVPTSRALHGAFDRLRAEPALRVAVLTGAGDRFFSAGWDLKAAALGEGVDADHGPGGFAGLVAQIGRHFSFGSKIRIVSDKTIPPGPSAKGEGA